MQSGFLPLPLPDLDVDLGAFCCAVDPDRGPLPGGNTRGYVQRVSHWALPGMMNNMADSEEEQDR